MPWPYLPDDYIERYGTSWATIPNQLYDPELGHHVYNRYLDVFEHAERVGFDGICVNEHHQSAYGTMPSPNIMAAALSRRTSRAKIAILGNAIPLRDHPLRVAEEVAMLDVITGGRIISGFVRGVGDEYTSFSMNPTYSRERFYEAHDLIIRAWTEPGPFRFEGRHYRFRCVNPWPRPLQKPHPPIWLPSQGSSETVEFAAERRYPFMQVFSPWRVVRRILDEYQEQAKRFGYTAPPEQIGWAVPIYVAETDAQAWRESQPHIEFLYNRLLRRPPHQFFPPGYLTEQSQKKVLGAKSGIGLRDFKAEELEKDGYFLVGSGATVRQKLRELQKESGIGLLVALIHFGSLPHELTVKNLDCFAEEVIPFFRKEAPAAVMG
jgi:alkanesulfonate monooxygenase SsuD/methylene tetrahydromethanopterin reductase-like flavin-dependent oxidoreductase (luciferase family)